jgi:hypothetical protein
MSSASSWVLTIWAATTLLEQAAHDRSLARPDLAGDDDEPLVLVQTVLEVGEGSLVAPAAEIEGRVRIQLERLAGQAEKGFVHRQVT